MAAFQLRDGRADVGQLDDVRFGPLGQFAQFGEGIVHALGLRKAIIEGGEDAAGQADVACFQLNICALGERGDNGQERVRRQCGCLVCFRVNDFCHGLVEIKCDLDAQTANFKAVAKVVHKTA